MNQKWFRNTLLIVLVIAVVIGGYFILSKRSERISEFFGKWAVASVEENGVQTVPGGSGATIEFFNDGTYQALGGCNEMSINSYTLSDSKISFKVGGTKKKCAENIVEFWDLTKVYSYELNDKILLLRYRTDDSVEGIFRLQRF